MFEGVLRYSEGDHPITYRGHYLSQNSQKIKHGLGHLKVNGFRHFGFWENNQTCGNGIEIYANDEMYVGNFQQGEKHGSGIYFYNNGSKYIGQWNEGLMNGYGLLIREEKYFTFGLWKDNILCKCLNEGNNLKQKNFFNEINYPNNKLKIGQIVITKSKEIGIITSKRCNGWIIVDFLDEVVRPYRSQDVNVLEFL